MAASFAGVVGAQSGLAQPIVPGSTYSIQLTMTGDTSYPTGGYPFGVTQLQAALGQGMAIQYVLVQGVALIANSVGTPATTAYLAVYDSLNGKIQLFGGAAGSGAVFAQVANATNVSTTVVNLLVFFR